MSTVLEIVQKATPAEKAEVLTELLKDNFQPMPGLRIVRYLMATEGDRVICIPITRSYPPPEPPVVSAEEEAEDIRLMNETDKHIPMKDFMKLVDQEIVKNTVYSHDQFRRA